MNQKIKISQLPAKGSNLAAADLLEIAEFTGTGYISKSITGQELIDAIPAPSVDWGDIGGTLSDQTDLNTALSGKVPTSRTLTINGTTQDLSADRTFTISTGITIGTTAITSGTVGRVLFEGTGNVVQQSSSLFLDATNNRLGIGTSSPTQALDVVGIIKGTTSAVGSMLSLAGANNTSLNMSNDSSGRTFVEVIGNTAATSNAGAYFTANGYQEAWFNVISRQASANNKVWRFGNLGQNNYFAIQKLNDAVDTILFTPLSIASSTGNVLINTTTDAGFRLDVNGTARIVNNTRIGTTVYSDTSSGLVIGGTAASAARAVLASPALYQDFQFVKTDIASGNINSWGFGQRQDTYFGNALGSFQIVGAYVDNSGNGSMVGGGFRVPLICNPNGDIIISGAANSINGNVSFGSTTIAASALVSITSTTKGFLPPRMTTTQKNAIASPAAGLMVYDTTLNVISYYNGTSWI